MEKRPPKVIRYQRPSITINIGMIVFLVFFLYILIRVLGYLTRPHLQIYEVGAISTVVQDTSYNGLILRQEEVQMAPTTGYVNVYVREGTRASAGDTVCMMDENGRYTEMLKSGQTGEENSLTAVQLDTLKRKLTTFSAGYRSVRFNEIYNVKYSLENQLLSYLSAETLNQIADVGINISYLKMVAADYSGVVEYYTDGMENLSEANLTAASLDDSKYKRTPVSSGTMVEKGNPVFKSITSERWYIYLPLTPEDQAILTDQSQITLLFNDSNLEVRAGFSLFTASDGTVLGRCELSDYMIQLADKRYVSVSVRKSAIPELNISGLKIPKTSVVTKELFVVPRNYAARGGNNSSVGFYQETFSSSGIGAEFVTPAIYGRNDDYYYLSMDEISAGTIFRKPTETDEMTGDVTGNASYTVGATATLQGVYNINKGYAQFKTIQVLDQNDDYYIVASGQAYGLAIYDHILLNGSIVKDGEVLY